MLITKEKKINIKMRKEPAKHQPLKIAFFLDGGEGGGIVEYMRLLISNMDKENFYLVGIYIGTGNSYTVLHTLFHENIILTKKRLVNYKSTTNKFKKAILNIEKSVVAATSLLRLAAVLREKKINIIDVNYYPHHILAGMAAKMAGVHSVWHWHSAQVMSRSHLYSLGYAIKYFCDIILPVNYFVQRSLPQSALAKSQVVYCAMDIATIEANQKKGYIRELIGAAPDDCIIAMVGTLIPLKGHRYFIEAADKVLATHPHTKFVIIGKETEAHRLRYDFENEIKEKVAALNRSTDILFLGQVPNASQYITDCTILCMPSTPYGNLKGEAFGLAMAEAMASGVPVIAADAGGLPEVVEHKVTGLLVPPKDSTALAEAMIWLLEDESLRKHLAASGQESIRRRFDIKKQVEEVQTIFKNLISIKA